MIDYLDCRTKTEITETCFTVLYEIKIFTFLSLDTQTNTHTHTHTHIYMYIYIYIYINENKVYFSSRNLATNFYAVLLT